jgi:nitrate reductase beta subunit
MANMFTAGDQTPVYSALQKMLSLRAFMRARTLDGTVNEKVLEGLDVSPAQVEEMYRYLGISDFNDRNVIPSSHKEFDSNVFGTKSDEGFTDEKGIGKTRKSRNLFGGM